jgi:hypothetical protein
VALDILSVIVATQQLQQRARQAALDAAWRRALLQLLVSLQQLPCRSSEALTARIDELMLAIFACCCGAETPPLVAPSSASERLSRTTSAAARGLLPEARRIAQTHLEPALSRLRDGAGLLEEDCIVQAAYGVKLLSQRCLASSAAEVASLLSLLLAWLLTLLQCSDSFLHLASLSALTALCLHTLRADCSPALVSALVALFGQEHALRAFPLPGSQTGPADLAALLEQSGVQLPAPLLAMSSTPRMRSLCGEALQRVFSLQHRALSLRRSAQGLLTVCLGLARERIADDADCSHVLDISSDKRRQPRAEGREEEQLARAEAIYLRQSALSLLGQLLVYLSPVASNFLPDVLDVALGVLQFELTSASAHTATRRAAIFLLRYLVEQHHEHFFTSSQDGTGFQQLTLILRQCKRSLASDADPVVQAHAQAMYVALQVHTAAMLDII